MKSLSCPDRRCSRSRKSAARSIIRHGFYKTRWGKRRRYQCRTCGKTFCSTTRTPYYRLQHRRATFDEVATLSVEGMSKSAIARVKRIAWNTVHRWLERAAAWCRRFNDRKIKGLSVVELQADEIKTIVGSKEQPIWIFAVIEVWSRLWPSTVVGKRSYQNTLVCLSEPFQPNESRTDSSGRHGWIRVLRESRQTSLWASVSLWSGDQDAQKRSHREGGAKSGAWGQVAIGTGAAGLGGLSETQHVVCRTIESHDPTGLGVSWPPDDLSSSMQKQRLNDHLELLRCHYNPASYCLTSLCL